MKIGIIITTVILILFVGMQVLVSQSTNEVEQYKYEVIKEYPEFEIRKYEAAIFTSVDLGGKNYESNSRGGFGILAGYIFGGNETGEEIAMTSPVAMDIVSDKKKMSFMVPTNYKKDDLPNPNDKNIYFEEKASCIMAAVKFGGWANDNKIDSHMKKLTKLLEKEGIKHKGNFSYFGYNPPYEVMNRRNEVVVEITDFK